jgi:hypothetical protein
MSTRKWNVWSIDDKEGRALVVDEGAKDYAAASAERRNKAAAKYSVSVRFEALPDGEVPSRRESPDQTSSEEER